MWCICTIWPNAPESQSVTMPYSHQNYWMHVFCFFFSGEHFGLWNVKIVVSAAESNFLRGLSETLSANLAWIKDFSHFSHLCAKLFIITSAFYCEKMPERDPIQVLVSILWLWKYFFPEFLFPFLCSLKDVCWLCGLMKDARCSSAVFSFFIPEGNLVLGFLGVAFLQRR